MGDRILPVVKRGPVNGVHGRNTQVRRGQPAQDAGLGAVRVHDLRANLPQQLEQSAIALPIAPRMDAAAELGDNPQIESAVLSAFDERPLRTEPRSANQRHVVAVQPMLVFDRQQRVLLRAADDQARDEMHDAKFHGCASP
jgi:hypothetical protein